MADDQTQIVEFLSRPGTLGADEVKAVTTHVSHVFLAGDRVFKPKRALKLPFLDASTVARREHFCRLELELNRRTAPEMYLDVHPITREGGGLALDGRGQPLDWVVEMRRFADGDLFDTMAAEGRLTPALMRELADAVAAFHAGCEATPDHGGKAAVAATLAGDSKMMKAVCPPLDAAAVDRLDEMSRAALDQLGPVLDQRRAAGFVRRCHGDLHLGNICLFEGRPTPFDCIDFNDDFSCIDVMYDLAFLVMDLVAREETGLANRLLNRYLDRTADEAGLAALPLFMSLRAGVRAEVGAIRAKERPEDAPKAQAYLALAETILATGLPRLIALGGLSGTGKSTVAQALAPTFLPFPGARLIRSDVIRKRLNGVAPEEKLPPEAYAEGSWDKVWDAMLAAAEASLRAGYSVILDATFMDPAVRNALPDFARRLHCPFTGLWLDAPAAVLRGRVAGRKDDASDADVKILESQLQADLGGIAWRKVDVSGTPEEAAANARAALDAE